MLVTPLSYLLIKTNISIKTKKPDLRRAELILWNTRLT
ncbi:hypothetical protein GLIP_3152 [Aliiglaciecola lipolytica E3]|uniref:Uncharacterized protein n=1 Tax=Aliiglaciecola lipolytica E3 TaxID=1127673 RepID=K6YGL7_9ALTE|nr:hypothetical protein GLIP_3152 [Aliiglaciecola lipolytica E3]